MLACNKKSFVDFSENAFLLLGGGQTIIDEGSGAFSHGFNNMTESQERIHEIGDITFEQAFVSAPAPKYGGLGPLYNNVSCVSCHVGDGRGTASIAGETPSSLLFRLSIAGNGTHGEPLPIPLFGGQLQNKAIQGSLKEADVAIQFESLQETYADGEIVTLQKPKYTFTNSYTVLPNALVSPRIASPVFGLGLLQAIPEEALLANADIHDQNADGISGKPNYVWNVRTKQKQLGRFGWKANQPDLLQQVAGAYNEDMGITNFIFPKENCLNQVQYDGRNDEVEVSDSLLQAVAFYIRSLAVPAARKVNTSAFKSGYSLFNQVGCNACHVENYVTQVDVSFPAISNQKIKPFTDLLLHEMGEGLADYRSDFDANGFEWRTAPLWGIGLAKRVNGHSNFLHDGRARNLEEAILWHGGEGQHSKDQFKKLSKEQRLKLIYFLENL